MDGGTFESLVARSKMMLPLSVLEYRLDSLSKKEVLNYFNLGSEHGAQLDSRREYLLLLSTLVLMKELTLDHQEDGFTASHLGEAWSQLLDQYPAAKVLFHYDGEVPSLYDLTVRARYLIHNVFVDRIDYDHDALVFDKNLSIASCNFSVLQRVNAYDEKQNEEHYLLPAKVFDFVLMTAEIFDTGSINIDLLRMNSFAKKKQFDKLLDQLNHSRANLKHQVNVYLRGVGRLDPNDQSSSELAKRFREKADDWKSNLLSAKDSVEMVTNSVNNFLTGAESNRSLTAQDKNSKDFQKFQKSIRTINKIEQGLTSLNNEMNGYRSQIMNANDKLISLISREPTFVVLGDLVKKLDQGPLKMQDHATDYLQRFKLLLPLFEQSEPRFTSQVLLLPITNPNFDNHVKVKPDPVFNSAEDVKRQEAEAKQQEQLRRQHQAKSIQKMFASDQDCFTFKEHLQKFSKQDLDFVKQDPNQFFMDLFPIVVNGDVVLTKGQQSDWVHAILQRLYADRLPVKLSMRMVGSIKIKTVQGTFKEPDIEVKVEKANEPES